MQPGVIQEPADLWGAMSAENRTVPRQFGHSKVPVVVPAFASS